MKKIKYLIIVILLLLVPFSFLGCNKTANETVSLTLENYDYYLEINSQSYSGIYTIHVKSASSALLFENVEITYTIDSNTNTFKLNIGGSGVSPNIGTKDTFQITNITGKVTILKN